jgi:hypothetical protein
MAFEHLQTGHKPAIPLFVGQGMKPSGGSGRFNFSSSKK